MTVSCHGCGLQICPTVCPEQLRRARFGLRYGHRAVLRATARSRISQHRHRFREAVDRWLSVLGLPSCPPPPAPEPWPAADPSTCVECRRTVDDEDGIPVETCDCCGLPFCAACAACIRDDFWLCDHCNGQCACAVYADARHAHQEALSAVFERTVGAHRAGRREMTRPELLKPRGDHAGQVDAFDTARVKERQHGEPPIGPLPNEAEIIRRWPEVYFRDGAAGRRSVLVDGPQMWCIVSGLRYATPAELAAEGWVTIDQIECVQAFCAAEPAAAAQIDAFLIVNDYLADPPPGYVPGAPDAWDLLDEHRRRSCALAAQMPWPADASQIKHAPSVDASGNRSGMCICGRKLISKNGATRPWCKKSRPNRRRSARLI